MKKKLIIGAIIAVVVIIVIWYVAKRKKSAAGSAGATAMKPGATTTVAATSATPAAAKPTASASAQAELSKSLRSKNWEVGGKKYTGVQLAIDVLPDGRIKIGSGYIGTLVSSSTVVTKERNGQPDKAITWKVV